MEKPDFNRDDAGLRPANGAHSPAQVAGGFHPVGKVTRRKDGIARVTGQELCSVDITLPRMLQGRVVASPYAHARIVSVDTSEAEARCAITCAATCVAARGGGSVREPAYS